VRMVAKRSSDEEGLELEGSGGMESASSSGRRAWSLERSEERSAPVEWL